jgi:hypothetical protein
MAVRLCRRALLPRMLRRRRACVCFVRCGAVVLHTLTHARWLSRGNVWSHARAQAQTRMGELDSL